MRHPIDPDVLEYVSRHPGCSVRSVQEGTGRPSADVELRRGVFVSGQLRRAKGREGGGGRCVWLYWPAGQKNNRDTGAWALHAHALERQIQSLIALRDHALEMANTPNGGR